MPKARTHLSFEISRDHFDQLKRMQKAGGLSSQKELIDNALTLTKWMMSKKRDEHAIGSLGEDGVFHELEMPFLEKCKYSGKRIY